MCTVVLTLDPSDPVPLRLLGVRDELTSRPWRPPGRHWTGSPRTAPLTGGIDEQAGGTWLAVHPRVPRVACLLNGRGQPADPAGRRSRGELPLRAAAEGGAALDELAADAGALAAYDPFILIVADLSGASVLWWTGRTDAPGSEPAGAGSLGNGGIPVVRRLEPGTHLFTNAGHAYPAGPGDPAGEPKAARFAEKFAAARPPAGPGLSPAAAWGDWLTLASGDAVAPDDPAAILVRRVLPSGELYGTTSMSLVALGAGGIRYDFQASPGDAATWSPVPLG